MVQRAIDGVNGDEAVFFEIEDRESSGFAIAAGDDAIVAVGNARHLQFDIELIGPEPWQGAVAFFLAGDGGGDALRLVGGVLDGFETEAGMRKSAGMLGTIADGEDMVVAGLQMFVDGDAVGNGEARFSR